MKKTIAARTNGVVRGLFESSADPGLPPSNVSRALRAVSSLAALVAALGGFCVPIVGSAQEIPRASALEHARANANLPRDSSIDLRHGLQVVLGEAECTGNGECLSCYQCHRVEGEGSAMAGFPRLAGQSFPYLYRALTDYASGLRQSGAMTPIAKALTAADLRDVAAYYSAEPVERQGAEARAADAAAPSADDLAEGGEIAAIGLAEKGVQACVNCHGPEGAGLPPTYPYLAGQYPDYLEMQLNAFKSGARETNGDANGAMADIARRLSANEIHDVAEYFGGIRPSRIIRERDYSAALLERGGAAASANDGPVPDDDNGANRGHHDANRAHDASQPQEEIR